LLLAIVAVALMQSSLVVINNNIKNELRDEAVNVAEQRMNEIRNLPFTDPALVSMGLVTEPSITRNIRAITNFSFDPERTVTDINASSKQVLLTIRWTYRNLPYRHDVSTVLRSQ
jgi:type II secretory pathway pseudopilin PulG